jgi:3-hydroxyacyl-[acyl-carrier-protein] dehydratase
MLRNDFFTVNELDGGTPSYRALLTLNTQHRIFGGHFPGQPVVPGVCLMQMVQEVTAAALGIGGLRLLWAGQIKFISPIDPRTAGELEMMLDCKIREGGPGADDTITVIATMSDGGKSCFKFNGVFERE